MEEIETETNSHGCGEKQQSFTCEDQSTDWKMPIRELLGLLTLKPVDLSIFKVPYKLRQGNEEAYSPRIVSIGPFHASTGTRSFLRQALGKIEVVDLKPAEEHENISLLQQTPAKKRDELVRMEVHKWWYMLHFLQITEDPKKTLNELGDAIKDPDLLKSVHRSYSEKINVGSYELVEMMLVDGCFILELFIRSWFKDSPYEKEFIDWFKDNTYVGDLIFHTSWMLPALRQDLALLENQIPFFILDKLYEIFMKNHSHPLPSITNLALSFFHPDLNMNQLGKENWENETIELDGYHLLDLLHEFYLPTPPETHPNCHWHKTGPEGPETWGFREGANNLSGAGIEFKKGFEKNFMNVNFDDKTGIIKIPPLRIDETTESLLRNLIALEQCISESKNHVSSYVLLMKSLIRSLPDIELLEKTEIITNDLGGNENVLNFFKNISMGVVPKEFCFLKLRDDVNKYRKSWWHWRRINAMWKVRRRKYLISLKRDYFPNPWSIISFIAAFMLLGLTILQTFYTVYSYYVDRH